MKPAGVKGVPLSPNSKTTGKNEIALRWLRPTVNKIIVEKYALLWYCISRQTQTNTQKGHTFLYDYSTRGGENPNKF